MLERKTLRGFIFVELSLAKNYPSVYFSHFLKIALAVHKVIFRPTMKCKWPSSLLLAAMGHCVLG